MEHNSRTEDFEFNIANCNIQYHIEMVNVQGILVCYNCNQLSRDLRSKKQIQNWRTRGRDPGPLNVVVVVRDVVCVMRYVDVVGGA